MSTNDPDYDAKPTAVPPGKGRRSDGGRPGSGGGDDPTARGGKPRAGDRGERDQRAREQGGERASGPDESSGGPRRSRRGGRRARDLPPPTGPRVSPALLDKLAAALEQGTYIVFDIETTGGNPERNGITEIFAIRWRQGEILGTFYSLVNPGIPIPPIVRRMTGISNQTVRGAPRIDEVMPKVVEFVGDDVLVSHNTIGDMRFLRHFAKTVCDFEMGNFYLCTHLLVEKLAPEAPDKSLKGLAEYFDLARGELHRAEADAYVTLELFKVLLGRLAQRSVRRIEEAVRLQGDMESGMRLGWGVDPDTLNDVPTGPGVFSLFDHEQRVLFLSSALQLDREVAKLRAFPQLPRQLLRLVLRSYALKFESAPNPFAAMLAESDALAGAGPVVGFHPSQWHQRFVQALLIIEDEDHLRLEVGPLEQGVKFAFGPVRDRRVLLEMVEKLGNALGGQPTRSGFRVAKDREGLLLALLDGRLEIERQQVARSKASWKLWFRRGERRVLADRLTMLDQLATITPPPRLDNLFGKSGVLAVQNEGGGWHLHHVAAARPRGIVEIAADVDPRRVIKEQGPALAETIRRDLAATVAAPLSLREALRANATLWWILYGRNESKFIPLKELAGELG